jgi:hypothetical protein
VISGSVKSRRHAQLCAERPRLRKLAAVAEAVHEQASWNVQATRWRGQWRLARIICHEVVRLAVPILCVTSCNGKNTSEVGVRN